VPVFEKATANLVYRHFDVRWATTLSGSWYAGLLSIFKRQHKLSLTSHGTQIKLLRQNSILNGVLCWLSRWH